MNKKLITLKLDVTSKIILLILGAGVWFMALKPLGPSPAMAEVGPDGLGPDGLPTETTRIVDALNRIASRISDLDSTMSRK
jgi:hypothetical protein